MAQQRQSIGVRIDGAAALAEHGRWLRTVVIARLGEPQAVDELMQEIATAVVAKPIVLEDEHKTPAFLYRLAIRQVLLYRRKCGRGRKLIERYAATKAGDEFSKSADPLDWLLQTERQTLVRQALARMHEQDAEILLLKYTEHWSCRELAIRLGVRSGAVEARLHRARQRLREQLATVGLIEVSKS